MFKRLHAALAFLTRLVPPPASPVPLGDCLPFFGVAGLVPGLLATAAAMCAVGLWGASTLACLGAAWLWLAFMAWATRAMHWDALADVADAAGSMAQGPRFREIMKDSRVGAFAVLAIVAVWLGQMLCVAAHLERAGLPDLPGWHAWSGFLPLCLAPAWARMACLHLAGRVPAATDSTLGCLVCDGVRQRVAGLSLAPWHALACVALVLCLVGMTPLALWQGAALLAAQALVHGWLAGLAQRNGGLSGDFLGADIELSQLVFLLLTLC